MTPEDLEQRAREALTWSEVMAVMDALLAERRLLREALEDIASRGVVLRLNLIQCLPCGIPVADGHFSDCPVGRALAALSREDRT